MAPGHPPSTMLELEVLNEGKSTMVSVASDGTVDDLKAEIAAAEGTEFENQKLKFRGKRMQDGQLLSKGKSCLLEVAFILSICYFLLESVSWAVVESSAARSTAAAFGVRAA